MEGLAHYKVINANVSMHVELILCYEKFHK